MKYFKGDYFCHTPIVDPQKYYDCKHIVSIQWISDDCSIEEMNKAIQTGTREWNNCIRRIEVPQKVGWSEYSSTLKQEVIDWLNENVKDSTDKMRKDMPQGWMIYDPMIVHESTEVSIFFLRGSDAVAFKLRWS